MLDLKTKDGKYTIIQHPNGGIEVLSHGESWRNATGDSVISSLAHELEAAREKIEEAKNTLNGIVAAFGGQDVDDLFGCQCEDCQYLRPIYATLKKLNE